MSPLLYILILKEPLVTLFFFYPKMFVVSYCQIYYLHPSLNLDKIVVFWSFRQKAEEICDLSHFKQEHVAYFDRTAFFSTKRCSFSCVSTWKINFPCWIIFHRIKTCNRYIECLVLKHNKTKIYWIKWHQETNLHKRKSNCTF